jgi:hypothetical protein
MRKLILIMVLFASYHANAVENLDVLYAGGTLQSLPAGTVGRLDTTGNESLTFDSATGRFSIPYGAMDSYRYSEEVARHLGVLPAIGTGLLRHRQKRHLFRISFHDAQGTAQVVILEVPKHMPHTLQAVLETRAPHACGNQSPCAKR